MKAKVIISEYLKNDKNKQGKFGLDVYNAFYKIEKENEELEIAEIHSHQKNIWCRDYMPVKRGDGQLVQFVYHPSYMDGIIKWEDHFPNAKAIKKELKEKGLKQEIISSDITLDGGAIEVFGDQAIVSDRVLRDNYPRNKYELLDEIKKILKLNRLIVVPEYPYDFTGHVDGIARFIDSKTVLINNDPLPEKKDKPKNFYKEKLLEQWHYTFQMAFENVGLKVKKIPMTEFKVIQNSKEKVHVGLYINFLRLDDLIIMPSFDQKENDENAAEILKELYNVKKVIKVNATKLASEGGLINCVTWDY